MFPCSENVSQPTIDSPTQEAIIGWNVTLECVSQRGSPPINYMLYKEKRKILQTVIKDKAGEKALFNFVISSDDKLGEYKCKVANQCVNSTKYSTGFTFKGKRYGFRLKCHMLFLIVRKKNLMLGAHFQKD